MTYDLNPQGVNLFRHYNSRPSLCNLYMMSDGTFAVDPQPDGWPRGPEIKTDESGMYPIAQPVQPWPATPRELVNNDHIWANTYDGQYTEGRLGAADGQYGQTPYVVKVFYGKAELTETEYNALVAKGWGGYIEVT